MGHEHNVVGEEFVTAVVIAMRVRVDDHRHRLVGNGLNLVHDALAVVGVLGIHKRDAVRLNEDGGIASAARHHVEIVANFEGGQLSQLRGSALSSSTCTGTFSAWSSSTLPCGRALISHHGDRKRADQKQSY